MDWFEHHLNWTAAGIVVCSIVAFLFFIFTSLGFNIIGWYYVLKLSFPCVLFLVLVSVAWLVLTMVGYGWILYNKNRNPYFLLFFLPAFFTIIGCLVYKILIFPDISFQEINIHVTYEIRESPVPFYFASSNIAVFIISWIVLFSLRNSTISPQNTVNNKIAVTIVSQNRFSSYFYDSRKRFKYILLFIVGSCLTISFISFFFINYGYLTYHLPESQMHEFQDISFKYPASFTEPVYNHVKLVDYENHHIVKYISLYYALIIGTDSDITIGFSQLSENLTKLTEPDTTKESILQEYQNPEEYQQIEYKQIVVNGIPAYQLAISVEHILINEIDWNDFGSHIYVYFEHNGIFWRITYHSWDSVTTIPPTHFTHLLESFKIYDE